MRRLSLLIVSLGVVLGSFPFAPAHARGCDEPGGCCRPVVVLGKTITYICPE